MVGIIFWHIPFDLPDKSAETEITKKAEKKQQ
jgi:hypothetical protein